MSIESDAYLLIYVRTIQRSILRGRNEKSLEYNAYPI